MTAGDLSGPLPERGLIGQVADPARDRPWLAGVGDQDPDVDALRHAVPGSDLIERLLHHPVQCLPGEPGEVDRDLRLLERPLYMRAQRDRLGGSLADEHPAALAGDDQAVVA